MNSNIKVSIPSSMLIEMSLAADPSAMEITYIRYSNEVVKFEMLKEKEVKLVFNEWLNQNIEKQKTGTFIPISTMKWAIAS
jgi:hypothetical protein